MSRVETTLPQHTCWFRAGPWRELADPTFLMLCWARIAIAESGLFTPADLAHMAASGARCFLVGESLMRADDVSTATATILANPVPPRAA